MMRSADTILQMVSERHRQHKKNGSYRLDESDRFGYDVLGSLAAFYALPHHYGDTSILSELFPTLSMEHLEVVNKLGMTRKEQLLHAAAIIVAELERIEQDNEATLCFIKYLP